MVATNTMTVTKTIRTLPQPKQWLIVGTTQHGINHFSISCLKCNLYYHFSFCHLIFENVFKKFKMQDQACLFSAKNAKILLAWICN